MLCVRMLVARAVVMPAILITSGIAGSASAQETQDSAYVRNIKPLLKARCLACHGALKQEAGLRLDTGEFIRNGSENGVVFSAEKSEGSRLLARITAADPEERMPPLGEPLTRDEITQIAAWIQSGAISPDGEQPEQSPQEHWSFRPLIRPAVPDVNATSNSRTNSRNPIDAFIAAKHSELGLTATSAAPKHVLLRRVTLDLIGLPPTRDELHEFLDDDSPDAYEHVVDRLLADPRYGERWGRHWMDIWRYADWHGRRGVPDVWNSAPQIWRWRDWIVKSLNNDKGYDRMVQEMLAADEICPEDTDAAVATGYLVRNWYALNPNDWMRNTVEHTGKAFLGLTFNCAHCHDHKYDPITQEDYFRLRAFFEPMNIRQDRVPGQADPGPYQEYDYSVLRKVQRLGRVTVFDKSPDAPTWFYTGGDERSRVTERGSIVPGVPAFLGDAFPPVTAVEQPLTARFPGLHPEMISSQLEQARAAIANAETAVAETTAFFTHSAGSSANALPEAEADFQERRRLAAARRLEAATAESLALTARIAADRAMAGMTSEADLSVLIRSASVLERTAAAKTAEADDLAAQVSLFAAESRPIEDKERAAAVETATKLLAAARTAATTTTVAMTDSTQIEVYTPLGPTYPATTTGRRSALATWITSEEHPLPARVAVNHIWARHFHAPLVGTVFDFGRNGAAPTHPELLDWLACELRDNGWHMKNLHRLIVTSAAYRRSSTEESEADPDNRWLTRMNSGRMEAEAVRDSLLYLGGKLDLTQGGQELENSEALTTFRRSLYYSCQPEADGRSSFGAVFDAADAQECYRRTKSIIPQQALALTNSDLIHSLATEIVATWQARENEEGEKGSGGDGEQRSLDTEQLFVEGMFEKILTRLPSETELKACRVFLARQSELNTVEHSNAAPVRAREGLVRVLLNHNDFLSIR